ncbi:YxcD family protein [Saccharibacillus sp. CPCC 101409]|uniref:YxcD family protein n=1 Tax=Saccharibacillus sp. CPCC 101409 TaxID=3058041 RepID=UPI002671E1E6|nr:YxcD family protein [Saccharibacillus sp. CPCC 101409]MDO3411851.1 YxcD family protein [Saccharibacillus sp. CPCC 101409]
MRLSMDEIVNAVCLNVAERRQIRPTDVTVELLWDEELGFSAEVTVQGRSWYLVEGNLIEAILRYLGTEYGIRTFPDRVRLELTDEIVAEVAE